jgi:hypothetical protein
LLPYSLFAQDNNVISNYRIDYKPHPSFSLSIYTGISVPVKGDRYWNAVWSPNYLIGAGFFKYLDNDILFGLRLSYNHWIVDQYALTKDLPLGIEWAAIEGSSNTIEVVPSLRIILAEEYKKSNIFMQIGAGVFNIKGNYSYYGTLQYKEKYPPVIYSAEKKYEFTKAGIELGLGLKSGRVEILPIFNVVFSERNPTAYLSFNLGLTF